MANVLCDLLYVSLTLLAQHAMVISGGHGGARATTIRRRARARAARNRPGMVTHLAKLYFAADSLLGLYALRGETPRTPAPTPFKGFQLCGHFS